MKWSDVKTELILGRNPSLIHPHQLLNQLEQLIAIEIWESQSCRRTFEAESVAFGPEQPDFSLIVFVGLRALESLDAVV